MTLELIRIFVLEFQLGSVIGDLYAYLHVCVFVVIVVICVCCVVVVQGRLLEVICGD